MDETQLKPFSRLLSLCLAVPPVIAASVIGSAATLPNIPGWYASIAKPWFTPPNWIFGPVWTTLFVMMAYAFYRVLRQPTSQRRTGVVWAFMLQLVFNMGWTLAFFGSRSPFLGLLAIFPLWLSVAWTMTLLWRRDRLSGALFIPYLIWVTFAGVLTFAIWRLNG